MADCIYKKIGWLVHCVVISVLYEEVSCSSRSINLALCMLYTIYTICTLIQLCPIVVTHENSSTS